MRIALSLLSLRPGQVGGAETYVRALVRHLPGVAGGDELLLVLDRDLDREIEGQGWTKVVMPYGARELVARRIAEAYTPWRDRRSEAVLAAARPDVTLFPQQSIFPHRAPGPAVLTAVDVQPAPIHIAQAGKAGAGRLPRRGRRDLTTAPRATSRPVASVPRGV